jgi:hypothetical protein
LINGSPHQHPRFLGAGRFYMAPFQIRATTDVQPFFYFSDHNSQLHHTYLEFVMPIYRKLSYFSIPEKDFAGMAGKAVE